MCVCVCAHFFLSPFFTLLSKWIPNGKPTSIVDRGHWIAPSVAVGVQQIGQFLEVRKRERRDPCQLIVSINLLLTGALL